MSYNDADLGYDLGYDTETVISFTINAPTQASGYSSSVTYLMGPEEIAAAARSGNWTLVHDLVEADLTSGALPEAEGTEEPEGTPTIPSGYTYGADPSAELRAREGRTETGGDSPEVEGDPDMSFSVDEVVGGIMLDNLAGTEGHPGVLEGAGFTPAQIQMFRDQYTGAGERELMELTQGEGESTEDYRERIELQMMRDFRTEVASRIMGRFEPGSITGDEAESMAMAAMRSHLEGETLREMSSDYEAGASREAIYGMVDSIPRGSRTPSDTDLYRDGARYEETRFQTAALDALREAEPARYRGAAGERRAREEAELFLASEGIDRNDPAAVRAFFRSPDFAERLTGFSESIRAMSPAQRGELRSRLIADAATHAAEDERAERADERALARQITDRLMAHTNAMEEAEQNNVFSLGQANNQSNLTSLRESIGGSMEEMRSITRGIFEATNNMNTVRPMTIAEIMSMVRNQPAPA